MVDIEAKDRYECSAQIYPNIKELLSFSKK